MVYRRRKVAGRRRNAPRRYRKRSAASKQGFLKIVRKLPEFWIANTAVAGAPGIRSVVATAVPGTEGAYLGTTLTLGTPTVGMNGASDVPFAMQFRLDDIINSADITTLCDKYKITGVYIRIFPNFNMNSIQSLFNLPSLQYVVDNDDATPPTVQFLREKMGVKLRTFKPGGYVGIHVRLPKAMLTMLNGAGTTSNVAPTNRWLDCNVPSIPHFGLKGAIMNMDLPVTTTSKISFKFDVQYTIAAKDFQ